MPLILQNQKYSWFEVRLEAVVEALAYGLGPFFTKRRHKERKSLPRLRPIYLGPVEADDWKAGSC